MLRPIGMSLTGLPTFIACGDFISYYRFPNSGSVFNPTELGLQLRNIGRNRILNPIELGFDITDWRFDVCTFRLHRREPAYGLFDTIEFSLHSLRVDFIAEIDVREHRPGPRPMIGEFQESGFDLLIVLVR